MRARGSSDASPAGPHPGPRSTVPDAVLREELARLLNPDGRPDAGDALDVLWIARLSGLGPLDWARIGDGTDPTTGAQGSGPLPAPPPVPHPTHDTGPRPPSARLHLPGGTGTAPPRPGGAHAVRVTQPHALPDALPLARALRPLRQTVSSARTRVLDVEATAATSGDTGLLLPVLRPASELRFSVDLLIDTGTTMGVWHRLADELGTLLTRHGAFADVRAWALHTDKPEPRLSPFRRGTRAVSPTRRWREVLADPTGRRAVLVLTDGVSPAWYGTELPGTLAEWSRERPVAALQVLPSRLWHRTALRTSAVRARGTEVARATIEVSSSGPLPGIARGRAGAADRARISWLPVLELSGPWLDPWARLVAGRATDWTPLLANPLTVADRPGPAVDQQDDRTTPAAWIERFEEGYSPEAFRLLRLLAAAPLSLPVMRLVQQTMLPSSTPMHLAEIFLSGLLVRRSPARPGEDPDTVLYDFRDGVREALLDRLTRTESLRVLREVMAGVSERVSRTLGGVTDFAALLTAAGAEGGLDGVELPAESRAFAEVALAVIGGAGGDYAALAARLGVGGAGQVLVPDQDDAEEVEAGWRSRRGWSLPWRRRRDVGSDGDEGSDGDVGSDGDEGSSAGASNKVPPLPDHYVPRSETGRVLEVLRRGSRSRGSGSRGPSIVVLTGHPGAGKTTLAIACARELAMDFTTVRWVRGHSREVLEEDLVRYARDLGVIRHGEVVDVDSLMADVYAHFASDPDLLLVLDGATAEVLAFVDRLPLVADAYGSMLVTCSVRAERVVMPHEHLELDDFTWDEAVRYVRLSLGPRGRFWEKDSEPAELVEVTGTNPGALAHAVSVIKTKDMSVRFRIMRTLASSEGIRRIEPSLVWITRDGRFIGTGVVVGTNTVVTGVVDPAPGVLRVHRLLGRGLDVTRVQEFGPAGLALLSLSEELSREAVAVVADDSRPFAALWFRNAGALGTPGLQLRSVSRELNDVVPGAVLIDEDGRLCALVRETPTGMKAWRIHPAPGFTQPGPTPPVFYLSYARRPSVGSRQRDLESRFFRDLSRSVSEITGSEPSTTGFNDRAIPPGASWEEELRRALAEAQVLVPLYSPSYFKSEWCGREFDAFHRRMEWGASLDGRAVSAIVPVIWLPTDEEQLPLAARSIQYSSASLSRRYIQEGLSGLLETGDRREYEDVVQRIAETVVGVARQARLRPCDPSDLADLRNAFDDDQL
ncbi:TIR-like protein FxsC [Streptomyces sp. NPDC048420]|uniref:TIR-like protein FxsC n=1 Tax=Streptomyces sp. NPDC048420 TaxID=3155755 RepID=UPI00343CBFD3